MEVKSVACMLVHAVFHVCSLTDSEPQSSLKSDYSNIEWKITPPRKKLRNSCVLFSSKLPRSKL